MIDTVPVSYLSFSLPLTVLLQNCTEVLWKIIWLVGIFHEYSENIQLISLNVSEKLVFFFFF